MDQTGHGHQTTVQARADFDHLDRSGSAVSTKRVSRAGSTLFAEKCM